MDDLIPTPGEIARRAYETYTGPGIGPWETAAQAVIKYQEQQRT